MKKRIFFILLIGIMILTACQAAPTQVLATEAPATEISVPPTETPVPPTEIPVPAAPVLEIVTEDGTSTPFTMDEIKALPVSTGQAGIKSSTGEITLPAEFTGVSLKDLAAVIGNFDETMGINVVAKDGYGITFSYDQAMNGTFTSYDPGTGDELKSPVPLTAILAYEMNGQPLDPEQDGDLRLVIISDEPKQVTDGHWSVKWINKLEIKSLGEDWSLHLEGAINELMDRATFESGASPNCHGVTWTDDKAQDWIGIPLWLLVGRVDDDIKHEGPAFNDELVKTGYTVDVVAADGYTVSFDAARINRNDNIIVAYTVNGNPLPEKYFPLRLVGSDLQKNEMAGAIEKIIVNVPPLTTEEAGAATEEPAATEEVTATEESATTQEPAATGEAQFTLSGLVENELSLTEADLRALEVVKITAEHPKKGPTDYEGIRLSTLFEMAKIKDGAKKLVLTASDGYTSEVFLAEVEASPDCLLAFTDEEGVFSLVMPDLPSSVWIKGIVKIEVQ
jgi:DMSO/TMAO reductase YedYZ molybdopterin-dependent catalytic subunit